MPGSAQGSSLASPPAPFAPNLESPGSRWGQLAGNLRVPGSAFKGCRLWVGMSTLGMGPAGGGLWNRVLLGL